MPPAPFSAWLGTLPDVVKVHSGTCRWYLRSVEHGQGTSQLLRTADLVDDLAALQADNSSGKVLAAVRLELISNYNHLMPLEPADRDQYLMWRQLLGHDLTGRFYCFRVLDATVLPAAPAYRKIEGIRTRGCVAELEHGEPTRLRPQLQFVPAWLQEPLPTFSVRLLPPQALLVSRGLMPKIWLPDLRGVVGGGLSWWRVDWKLLGIVCGDLPSVPAFCRDAEGAGRTSVKSSFGFAFLNLAMATASSKHHFSSQHFGAHFLGYVGPAFPTLAYLLAAACHYGRLLQRKANA
jgi:hypothetical protein